MNYIAATITNAGPRRQNEDAVGVWTVDNGLAVAVADGLGGMGGGKRASEIAISCFERYLLASPVNPDELLDVAKAIHAEILSEQKGSSELATMATTFTAGVFLDNLLHVVHSGDSRLVVARRRGIRRLTNDHSEAHRLFAAGKLNKEELLDYPRKNILESALGIHGDIEIDNIKFETEAGDKFFFSTDGVHNIVHLRELHQLALRYSEPQELVSKVEDTIGRRGAEDNYSLIAVYLSEK